MAGKGGEVERDGKESSLLAFRESLDKICKIPDDIISVYSLEQHVWADGHCDQAIKERRPNLETIREFQIGPVLHFLNDIFRQMAAPYSPERRENPVGQGYWIQAEFGSGKSHLLCFLAAMALGSEQAWEIVRDKERQAGRGKGIYSFWEAGLEAKSRPDEKNRGIFVIVQTLVGHGGTSGGRLVDYILEAAKRQLQKELGKNISLYPEELLADRLLQKDMDLYRCELRKFLKDPRFFEEDEQEELEAFLARLQDDRYPDYRRSCGHKLWRFYDEYLGMLPRLDADLETILAHMVRAILAEGYSGVLLLLDEVSLFMKDRDDKQRAEDEKTLVVLSNRLTRAENLPIWTVCTAQQAIMGTIIMNIIAEDRMKLVPLLRHEKDYYEIVLSRVREIIRPEAISSYYSHYRRGFTWSSYISEEEFRAFFPFHKSAIEVLRAITYELTTTRSAIHFMHQTLRYHMHERRNELIRLWDFFDEALTYEEDPSGIYAGLSAIKARRDSEYRIYESCRKQIDSAPRGVFKVHRERAIRTLQVLFLYHLSRLRQQGIYPWEIANAVLIEREPGSPAEENNLHYDSLAEALSRELPQIVKSYDEENRPRFSFKPTVIVEGPKNKYEKARWEAEASELMQSKAWEHLLALDRWPVTNRKVTIDMSFDVQSIFCDISPFIGHWEEREKARHDRLILTVPWQNREVSGSVEMLDLGKHLRESIPLPGLDSAETDLDFLVLVGMRPLDNDQIQELLRRRNDPRVILWVPDALNPEERDRLVDFAAYRKLVFDNENKDSEEAVATINWVADQLRNEIGKIYKIVESAYARGRMDALNNSRMDFHTAGGLGAILQPIVDRVLRSAYVSNDIRFEGNLVFTRDYALSVINGIVRKGEISRGEKGKNADASRNFGPGLKISRRGQEHLLDVSDNPYVQDILRFIEEKGSDGRSISVDSIYKNFMGLNGPYGKSYGLSRRIIQIYLLCLVREGKIRISLGPRSGLNVPLDSSNIAEIDFSAKVLDSLHEVQRVVVDDAWIVLRPYASKLLNRDIPDTLDEAQISSCRRELIDLFRSKNEEAQKVRQKSSEIFGLLKAENPYQKDLDRLLSFFCTDLTAGEEVDSILFALDSSLGYKAFEKDRSSQEEVDDLANLLRIYDKIREFLGFERELATLQSYLSYELPDIPELGRVRKIHRSLADRIKDPKPYVDSDLKFRSEILGSSPDQNDTLQSLLHEYSALYSTMHDNLLSGVEECRAEMAKLLTGDELRALEAMEAISAIPKGEHAAISRKIAELKDSLFSCHDPSASSLNLALHIRPEHDCGLSFARADGILKDARSRADEARTTIDDALNRRAEILYSPAIRERLSQGIGEPAIDAILACHSPEELRSHLVESLSEDPSVVDVINRYLKRVVIKAVKISDFQPTIRTVEREHLERVVSEFRKFLEDRLSEPEIDSRLMLQLE